MSAVPVVLVTDHPWPDVDTERSIIEGAGYRLEAGPMQAPTAQAVEALVAKHDPVAILTCWAQVSAMAIQQPTVLKMVGRMGVGLDNIAVAAATARGAWVTNVPDYCVEEVSDHAVAMLLDLWRGVTSMDREVKTGLWNSGVAKLRRVSEMTVGIIGYGNTGSATARKLAEGFRCRVLVNAPSLLRKHRSGDELSTIGFSQPPLSQSPGERKGRVFVADIATMQQQADAIVLHAPLTSESHHLVDTEFLSKLKRRPLLVNVSRGGLVDNDALCHALDAGLLAGAGLDVIEGEPSPPASVTLRPDVIATPHMAFSSDASLAELRRRCAEEVVRVLRGEPPRHPCNRI